MSASAIPAGGKKRNASFFPVSIQRRIVTRLERLADRSARAICPLRFAPASFNRRFTFSCAPSHMFRHPRIVTTFFDLSILLPSLLCRKEPMGREGERNHG